MVNASDQVQVSVFVSCPKCGNEWGRCGDFLSDRDVRLLGFQSGSTIPNDGLFLFTHERCGTTLAVELSSFRSLLPLPALAPSCWIKGDTPSFCLGRAQEICCPLECICEHVWILSHTIASWPKRFTPAA
jgi:hypothetical protein